MSLLLTTYLQMHEPRTVQNTQQHFDRPLTNRQSNSNKGSVGFGVYLRDKRPFVEQLISRPFGKETKLLAHKRNLSRPSPNHRRRPTIRNKLFIFLTISLHPETAGVTIRVR